MTGRLTRAWRTYGGVILFGLVGIPIGVAVGAIDALFGRVLLAISAFRDAHVFALVPFLAAAGALIAWAYLRFGKNTGRGMSLVFDVGLGRENVIPLRLIPLIMGGTWITHLFGGSAGREGVAVQIGATLSHWIGQKLPFRNPGNTFLLVGMAAGFAGLFGTPLAATLFALEVLVAGRLEYRALFPALTASIAASATSKALGLAKFEVALSVPVSFDLPTLGQLLLLGVAFGIVGGLFAWCLGWGKRIAAAHLENPIKRIFVMGLGLSVLFLLLGQGRYCGLGTNLISASFAIGGSGIVPWDFALKFALTILTLSAGYQGGEVTPLFAIGASLGVALGSALGMPVELAAALGYAAVFGSATNTLLAPMFIGAEVFGFAYLPYFFVVCVVAYLFNMDKSIYALQEKAPGIGARQK
ncbi:MAG: chloride channel protein [Coriobacteriales bacterium]|nr:chloride channel protein [Coriobacteriales bacterium]